MTKDCMHGPTARGVSTAACIDVQPVRIPSEQQQQQQSIGLASAVAEDHGHSHTQQHQHQHHRHHVSYRIEYRAIQGWFQMLHVVSFLIMLSLMLILSAQIFEKIAWREGIVVIVPEFFYPVILNSVAAVQRVKYASAAIVSGVLLVGLNGFFAFRMLYVLFDCDNHELCSFDPMIYVWYCGAFVALELFTLASLCITLRVMPSMMKIYNRIEKYRLLEYVHAFERKHPTRFGCVHKEGPTATAYEDADDSFIVHAHHPSVSSISYRLPSGLQ